MKKHPIRTGADKNAQIERVFRTRKFRTPGLAGNVRDGGMQNVMRRNIFGRPRVFVQSTLIPAEKIIYRGHIRLWAMGQRIAYPQKKHYL
jgi:hypothetical protein